MARTLVAAVTGYFTMAFLSVGAQILAAMFFPQLRNLDSSELPSGYLAADLAWRTLFGIGGGWLASALAKQRMGSTGMAVLAALFGCAAMMAFGGGHWYRIATPVAGVAAAILGGLVWQRTGGARTESYL